MTLPLQDAHQVTYTLVTGRDGSNMIVLVVELLKLPRQVATTRNKVHDEAVRVCVFCVLANLLRLQKSTVFARHL